jgi:hypothetical protein
MSEQLSKPSRDTDKPAGPLADLAGPFATVAAESWPPVISTPSTAADAQPWRPWGFWTTLGLTLVVLTGWLAPQTLLVVFWMLVTSASGRAGLSDDPGSNGLFLALATCASAPVSIGLACLFAWVRARTCVREYLGLRPVRRKELLQWGLVLLLLVFCSDTLTMYLERPIVPEFMARAYESAGFAPLF